MKKDITEITPHVMIHRIEGIYLLTENKTGTRRAEAIETAEKIVFPFEKSFAYSSFSPSNTKLLRALAPAID